jgi:DNA-directed RNA polymerase subunit K/omega
VNNIYLERAKKIINDPKILSLVTSKRARQLALGMRPMVKCKSENWLDVALLEIAEGKLSYEFSDIPEEDTPLSDQSETDAETVSMFAQQIVSELEDNDSVMSDEEYFQSEAENEIEFSDIFDEEDDSEAYRSSMKDKK